MNNPLNSNAVFNALGVLPFVGIIDTFDRTICVFLTQIGQYFAYKALWHLFYTNYCKLRKLYNDTLIKQINKLQQNLRYNNNNNNLY